MFACAYVFLSSCTSTYINVVEMGDPAIFLLASYLTVVVTDRMKFLLQKSNSGLITNSNNACWY